jgi:hypothetical protein
MTDHKEILYMAQELKTATDYLSQGMQILT